MDPIYYVLIAAGVVLLLGGLLVSLRSSRGEVLEPPPDEGQVDQLGTKAPPSTGASGEDTVAEPGVDVSSVAETAEPESELVDLDLERASFNGVLHLRRRGPQLLATLRF